MARPWTNRTASLRQLLKELSWPPLILLGLAVFFLFTTYGFLIDIMAGGRQPTAVLATTVIFSGTIALLYGYGGVARRPAPIVLGVALHILFYNRLPHLFAGRAPLSAAEAPARLGFDAAATLTAVIASYTCFIWFTNTTAARYLRIRAEIDLAREIHRVLVPRVATVLDGYEFFGTSVASGDVGGDLVDVVAERAGWIGYVADVSGHGVSSGVVMGMFKSALRVRLLAGGSLADLARDLNAVLIPLKSPAMYVTFAAVRRDGDRDLEFIVAGHLPVLKRRADGSAVEEVTTPQLPIGVFENTTYIASRVACADGDLLALVTDGLTEVFDRHDQQFGLEHVKELLAHHGGRPLPEIAAALTSAAAAFGRQLDDQTLLLVRRKADGG